ncbi:hypothetical protein [Deinococcus sp. S9]|uniref:hypothetical protein n=1 Tax=Deinococcus sp. S9 TaxID=2545754 RepID=UPI0010549E1C|nr:hypothetical protein [Deinococcus sp. S9]TDE87422.1 hypothetical protein E0686_02710 [Deinococcus sp. S9]
MLTPYGKGTLFPGLTPREVWAAVDASWAGPDKLRVRVTHSNRGTVQVAAQELELARQVEQARRQQLRQQQAPRNVVQGRAIPEGRGEASGGYNPLDYLPEAMKIRFRTEGGALGGAVAARSLGLHNEGVPHYGVSNGMGAAMGERRNAQGEWTCGRGRGTVHGGARSGTPPSGEGLDALFEQEKVVALAEYDWRNAKGKKKEQARHHLHVQRRKLQQMQSERANRGLMHSARTFESFNASKSTRGQARAEAIKQEDGKPRARL